MHSSENDHTVSEEGIPKQNLRECIIIIKPKTYIFKHVQQHVQHVQQHVQQHVHSISAQIKVVTTDQLEAITQLYNTCLRVLH